MRSKLFFTLSVILLWACEKEESPYPPAIGGLITAEIGSDYSRTSYFDISSGEFVVNQPRDLFSLAFSSDEQDTAIFMNSFNFMYAKKTLDTNFLQVTDSSAVGEWDYDFPTGEHHRTALRDFLGPDGLPSKEVFILDLGYDVEVNRLPAMKLQVLHADDQKYVVRYADLDGGPVNVATIQRDPSYRRVMLDMISGQQMFFEPFTNDWDLCFSQYTDYDLTTDGDTLSYLVRGVLFDSRFWEVAMTEELEWSTIDLTSALDLDYSTDESTIGYDWKRYDFDLATYVIESDRVYVLRSANEGVYKLRFLDYFNDAGERGYPRFELEGL